MTQNADPMIQLTIQVPLRHIKSLQEFMDRQGIHLDVDRQVTAINDALMDNAVAMGHHIPDLIMGINRHLKTSRNSPEIPMDHERWSLEQRQQFLELAIREFQWNENHIEYSLWEEDGRPWLEVVAQHPRVFASQEPGGRPAGNELP